MKKSNAAHNSRVDRYLTLIEGIKQKAIYSCSKLAIVTGFDGSKPFTWSDYPYLKNAVIKVKEELSRDMYATIVSSISSEWMEANHVQDGMVNATLKSYGVKGNFSGSFQKYYNSNEDLLEAFIKRRVGGQSLSQRIWNVSSGYIDQIEATLGLALENGTSAVQLSKSVSRYLNNFSSIQKGYTLKYGRAAKIENCEYQSARLARTTINMAYRTSELSRWNQLDFVVGFEVKRSGRDYACEVCSSLIGKYPKNFIFVGWHPNCRCYMIPILKTEDEFWSWDGNGEPTDSSIRKVNDVPDGYKTWVLKNEQRIGIAKSKGTLPYFLKDNVDTWKVLIQKK